MSLEREREIRALLCNEPPCVYVGRCNSERCPQHSPERRAERRAALDLFDEIERMRAQLREAAEEIEHYSRERKALRAEALREAADEVSAADDIGDGGGSISAALEQVADRLRAMADEAARGAA